MQKTMASRKQRFRAALALAGLTAAEWAEKEVVSKEHLSRVLNGKQAGSMVLLAKIDEFTNKQLARRMAMAG
jgi:transcriptional regulator with XRE-family HTH domain